MFLTLALCAAPAASAADRVYWSNTGSGTIRGGNLDGSGAASTLFTEPGGFALRGIAANPAANRIYWTSSALGAGAIRVGNLDGTGTASNLFADPISFGPWGLAADPAANRVYWSNPNEQTIRVANLDGTGAPTVLFSTSDSENPPGPVPRGVAADPAGGKVWWSTNEFSPGAGGQGIMFGNANGSGTPTTRFDESGGPVPNGLAIDRTFPASVHWAATSGTGLLMEGNVDSGGASASSIQPGLAPNDVAIDPVEEKIYWADADTESIRVANLSGLGDPETLFTEAPGSDPQFLTLVRAPAGSGVPVVTGGAVGHPLSCTQGSWEPDLPGAHLFREPRSYSYQWAEGGTEIPGATASHYTPTAAGSYDCTVTATNQAGSASQTSADVEVTDPAPAIYWSSRDADTIRAGNLDGIGGAGTLFTEPDLSLPQGVAIDPAANRIYWADSHPSVSTIRVANLDGTGTPSNLFSELGTSSPFGVAIDPAANKIYWANSGTDQIRVGNLDGTGGPIGSPLFTETAGSDPAGVAIDPAANKIYWANASANTIRVANLDGTGTPSDLFTELGSTNPLGVAIDPAGGRIYWASSGSDQIRVGNLDGSGGPIGSPLFIETGGVDPTGVAIDPAANRIYWTNSASGVVRVGNLDGTGTPSNLFSEPSGTAPAFPALLRPPSGTAPPTVSGGGAVGQELTCSQGAWAPNLLGAHLYRAPRSFARQWRKDGADIPGATGAAYTPTSAGSYACRVTATNLAGSASQTSAGVVLTQPDAGSPPGTNPASRKCKKKQRKKRGAAVAGKCKKKKRKRKSR